jgi:small subunit ribosomal protein S9
MSQSKYFYGVGRRKASVARAKVYESAKLEIIINKRNLDEYFPSYYASSITEMLSNVNLTEARIELFINGGGVTGQSEAARLAIANAILKKDDDMYRHSIRKHDYNTTDIRKVLSKKSGRPKARKSRQWVKR